MEDVVNTFSKRIPFASLHVKSSADTGIETLTLKQLLLNYLACTFPSYSLLSFIGERKRL